MSKIENYLNSLDKKNITLLYLSVVIAFGVLYYNVNYSIFQKEIDLNNQKIIGLKNKLKNTSLSLKLKNLKIKLKKLKKENVSLKEDLKYLNVRIKTSVILHIDEKNFLNILRSVLQEAVNNNIKASFTISKKVNDYKTYIIEIKGEFAPFEFNKFYRFIKNLENIKAVKEITNLNLSKNKNVTFEIKILFWSLK